MTGPDIVGIALILVIGTIALVITAVGLYVTVQITLATYHLILEHRDSRRLCPCCAGDPISDAWLDAALKKMLEHEGGGQ